MVLPNKTELSVQCNACILLHKDETRTMVYIRVWDILQFSFFKRIILTELLCKTSQFKVQKLIFSQKMLSLLVGTPSISIHLNGVLAKNEMNTKYNEISTIYECVEK